MADYGSLRSIGEDEELPEEGEDGGLLEVPSPSGSIANGPDNEDHRRRRSRAGLRSMYDSWLRRDHSISSSVGFSRSILSSMVPSTSSLSSNASTASTIGSTGTDIESFSSSVLFGPTDRSVEALVRARMPGGVQYKSVDRGLVDTAVWHRRKVALLNRRRKARASTSTRKTSSSSSAFSTEEMDGKYKYDSAAVAQLQSERWVFDQLLVAGIGVAMAITGLAVSRTADMILDWKLEHALERFEKYGFASGMAFHVGVSSLLAFGAFLPVAFRPISAGSGIAEAKAALNGVVIPKCTSLLTALCKGTSVILSVAASLPAGLEGPMIHLGLCIGENANRLVPRKYQVLDPLRTDRARIDYTAIGTAAGVAAAFRAPISGILFAMEEGASYWSTSLTWRCFLSACTCVIAMYCILSFSSSSFQIVSMDLFNGIDVSSRRSVTPVIPAQFVPSFDLWEYALFVLVGTGGGFIGAAFCVANRAIAVLRRRWAMGPIQKCLEVLVVAAVYTSLSWVLPSLPFLSSCGNIADRQMGASYFRQFDCPQQGQYNELATLLLNPLGGKGITLLFQEDDDEAFSAKTCLAAGIVQVVTLCIAFGISVSAGIFIPLLFIGACFGRALALIIGLDPRTYAIVGAAACLGGVVRVLISLTAIVTSTTSLSFFITPCMIVCLMAQTVGNWASGRPGIYDIILQLRDVPFLEEQCPEGAMHANIRARNVMKTGVITIGTQVKVSDLLKLLRAHDFSDFPVVDRDANGHGEGALVGSISRVDLLALLSRPDIFFPPETESSIEDKALSFSELDSARPILPLPGLEAKNIGRDLSAEDKKKYVHLSPYIQIAPHTFDGHGSAERAYEMFRCLGLRKLLVVDKRFRPIGIITRHELVLLEEIGVEKETITAKSMRSVIYTNLSDFKDHFE